MKIRYELHIGGEVIHGNLDRLKQICENSNQWWELYQFIIPKPVVPGKMKLSQQDIMLAIEMKNIGKTYAVIAREFGISIGWACDIIRMESRKKLKYAHT